MDQEPFDDAQGFKIAPLIMSPSDQFMAANEG